MKIFSTIIAVILVAVNGLQAAEPVLQDSVPQTPKVTKWIAPKKDKIYFVGGGAVWVDFVGLGMKVAGAKFSQMEIGARVTIVEKIFPIFEIGLATSHREGNSKDNTFSTPTSPYFRVGFDVNLNKKRKSNRFMLGFRYGYSSFKYDFVGPDQIDPVWGTPVPLNMTGIPASAMWGEGVLGFEAKLWSFICIGWNARFKFRFTQDHPEYQEPWYIPGFGPNGGNCWGGTVNLIFDFGRSMKKGK